MRRIRASLRSALLAPVATLALLALPACDDDPTGLGSVAGTYHLELYQGEPLPALIGTVDVEPTTPGGPSFACEQRIVGSVFTLDLDGSFARVTEHLLDCDPGGEDETTTLTETGHYALDGDGVRLTFDVPADARYTSYTELARRTPDTFVVYRAETVSSTGTAVNEGELVYRPE